MPLPKTFSLMLKWGGLASAVVNTFKIPVASKQLNALFQVVSAAQLMRLLFMRRWKAFVGLILATVKFGLVKDEPQRSLLGHILYDLSRLYSRWKLNLPPSVAKVPTALRYGPFQRHKTDLEVSKVLGPISSANRFAPLGSRTFIWLSDPDAVQQVMTDKITYPSRGPTGFTDQTPFGLLGLPSGDLHSKHRRLIGKFMTNRYLESFSKVIEEETSILLGKWESYAEKNKATNVCYDLSMITLQVIMRASVGTTGEPINQQYVEENDNADYHGLDYALKEIMISTAIPILGLHPSLKLRRFKKYSEDKFEKVMAMAEESYRKNGGGDTIYASLKSLGSSGNQEDMLTDREIMDEMLTVRGAGHETTSHTLSWALLLLSKSPECMKLLQEEADQKLKGDIATYEETKTLEYTHMVIYETLRMYPTVPSFPREAAVDTKLLGYDIPKGALVFVCQNAMNRNDKLWTDPNKFDPSRFKKLPELLMSRPIGIPDGHAYGFIPFGAGNRTCVGQRLAMLEAVQMLSSIAKRFSWSLAHPQKRISEVADITLGPKEGLDIKFWKRCTA